MKCLKLSLLGLVGMWAEPLLAVQRDEKLAAALEEPLGELSLPVTALDRGSVQQGETLFFEFPYKVSSTGSVRILGIHQECGCLSESLKPGTKLEAGSEGVIRVQADTSHFVGNFDKKITIITDEADNEAHVFRVRAKIDQSLSWQPALVELDLAKVGDERKFAKVSIRNVSKQSLHIEKLRYNEDNLEVVKSPMGDGWELLVRWKGEKPRKAWAETIEISTDGVVKTFKIPVVEKSPPR